MSTIIVYKRTNANPFALSPAERREGMKDAGDLLRTALSAGGSGSANDVDAEDRVVSVLDDLIAASAGNILTYDIRLEDSRLNPVRYKIDGQVDNRGRYLLTHPDNLIAGDINNAPKPDNQLTPQDRKKNGKLRLDVGLDDLASNKNIFRMRVTVPKAAGNAGNWIYLSDDINGDLNQVETGGGSVATNVQNYLISTFMFSRCR